MTAESADFVLSSPTMRAGEPIPREYTCDGDDRSPPLWWSGVPPGTQAFALIVEDPDARDFAHWVLPDLPAGQLGLAEGASTDGGAGREGRNDFGRTRYGGPCPPSGSHRYVFRLYALSRPLRLDGAPTAAEVRSAMSGAVLGEATLEAVYPGR